MVRIVVAEDHEAFRGALLRFLSDYEIVGVAGDGITALQTVEKTHPELLLLDLSMARMSGISVLQKVKSLYPEIKVVVITMFSSSEYFQACVEAGVDGYVLKDETRETLIEAINRVLAGEKYFSAGVLQQ